MFITKGQALVVMDNLRKNKWTKEDYLWFQNELQGIAEEPYREFHSKLVPTVDNILGIRVPVMRKIAKEIAKGNLDSFIHLSQDRYYEETMICGLVISHCGEIAKALDYLKQYVPRISNWAVCDSVCASLRIFQKYPEEGFRFLQNYINSIKEFELRFILIVLLFHYINSAWIDHVLKIIEQIHSDDYYVMMAQAWLTAECCIQFEEKSIYLLEGALPQVTVNKAIQKIRESRRPSQEKKDAFLKYRKKEGL